MVSNGFSDELLRLAQDIKVAFFDVDGVLSDGGLYYSAEGESLKRFNSMDGLGLRLLTRYTDIRVVVITGRDSLALRKRLADLDITNVTFKCTEKLAPASQWLTKLNCSWDNALMLGDDWIDLPLLSRVKLACAPPDAHAEVLKRADYITRRGGGRGCVREVIDLLLQAKGCYQSILDSYLSG